MLRSQYAHLVGQVGFIALRDLVLCACAVRRPFKLSSFFLLITRLNVWGYSFCSSSEHVKLITKQAIIYALILKTISSSSSSRNSSKCRSSKSRSGSSISNGVVVVVAVVVTTKWHDNHIKEGWPSSAFYCYVCEVFTDCTLPFFVFLNWRFVISFDVEPKMQFVGTEKFFCLCQMEWRSVTNICCCQYFNDIIRIS